MTDLHLDSDEWAVILEALKDRRDSEQEHAYRKYIAGVTLKVEIALQVAGGIHD